LDNNTKVSDTTDFIKSEQKAFAESKGMTFLIRFEAKPCGVIGFHEMNLGIGTQKSVTGFREI